MLPSVYYVRRISADPKISIIANADFQIVIDPNLAFCRYFDAAILPILDPPSSACNRAGVMIRAQLACDRVVMADSSAPGFALWWPETTESTAWDFGVLEAHLYLADKIEGGRCPGQGHDLLRRTHQITWRSRSPRPLRDVNLPFIFPIFVYRQGRVFGECPDGLLPGLPEHVICPRGVVRRRQDGIACGWDRAKRPIDMLDDLRHGLVHLYALDSIGRV